MKITKYNQSCLLIETNNKRILVDPGTIGYDESLLNDGYKLTGDKKAITKVSK